MGLPVHVLVNHAVVVLVPVAALAAAAIALVPRWRSRYGPLVAVLATAAVATVPVAVSSGEWLQERLGYPEEGFRHGEVAEHTLWWTLPLWVLTVALVLLERLTASVGDDSRSGPAADRRAGPAVPPVVMLVLAGLVVVAAAAATYQVVRVGHLGTESVWQGRVPAASSAVP